MVENSNQKLNDKEVSRVEKEIAICERQLAAREVGVEIDLPFANIFDLEHLDCVWYGGYIGSLRYKGYTVDIEVRGDVNLSVLGEIGEENLFNYKNKNNVGAFFNDEFRELIKNDQNYHNLCEHGMIVFKNNNWVEFVVCDKEDNDVTHIARVDTVLDDNVLDAFDDVMYYKDIIDKIDQRISKEQQSRSGHTTQFEKLDSIIEGARYQASPNNGEISLNEPLER